MSSKIKFLILSSMIVHMSIVRWSCWESRPVYKYISWVFCNKLNLNHSPFMWWKLLSSFFCLISGLSKARLMTLKGRVTPWGLDKYMWKVQQILTSFLMRSSDVELDDIWNKMPANRSCLQNRLATVLQKILILD